MSTIGFIDSEIAMYREKIVELEKLRGLVASDGVPQIPELPRKSAVRLIEEQLTAALADGQAKSAKELVVDVGGGRSYQTVYIALRDRPDLFEKIGGDMKGKRKLYRLKKVEP